MGQKVPVSTDPLDELVHFIIPFGTGLLEMSHLVSSSEKYIICYIVARISGFPSKLFFSFICHM